LQPNFAECWWDHWVLDFAICNTLGIVLGELLLRYLNSRTYSWVGLDETPTIRGKALRALAQFTPQSWTPYQWHMLRDLRRLGYVLAVCAGIMVVELDAFFLKDILWAPPESKLNLYRLLIWFAVGMVGLRDYYAFMTDSRVKRLGSTAWIMLAMAILELLVVVKFAPELYKGRSIPAGIAAAWAAAAALAAAWVVWWYFLRRRGAPPAAAAQPADAEERLLEDAPAPAPPQPPAEAPAAGAARARAPRAESAARAAAPAPSPAKASARSGRELGNLLAFELGFGAAAAGGSPVGSRRRR